MDNAKTEHEKNLAKCFLEYEERISKFKENKKSWLEDIIKAKKDFRNEISYNLTKTMEQPKLIVIGKNDNKEILSKNKKMM